MKTINHPAAALLASLLVVSATGIVMGEANPPNVLTGHSAFVTSSGIKPGAFRKITTADLPKPFMTESATLRSRIVPKPAGALPQAPAGFHVGLFADGLKMPRVIRVAPNGDIFLAGNPSWTGAGFQGPFGGRQARPDFSIRDRLS